ncbi:MAG: hypothetical protein IPK83_04425 [Planctomycetes bacterium]|nr:hypothetical protein [Planctomycetota bacterium]
MSKKYLSLLRNIVNLPTAPFVETSVIRFITDFIADRPALRLSRDRFGNMLVRYQPKRKSKLVGRPVLFAAHMDHPGFVATKMVDKNHVHAEWRGWVQSQYFHHAKIQFFSGGRWIPAVVTDVQLHKATKAEARQAAASARSFGAEGPPDGIIAKVKSPVAKNSPGMWALSDATIKGTRLHARACDDLAGLAAILCMLDEVCKTKSPVPTFAFFTRAEEVGFAGALAAVADKTVPRNTVVVAVENSKAITGVGVGDGPVLRVGDKATVFTPAATAYCHVVADKLKERDKTFAYQRKLMDGGTCESTAYCHHGYDATGICLPLVNYHNMDMDKKKIAPESIDTRDFLNLVKWFVALSKAPATLKFDGTHPGLDDRLSALLKKYRTRLVETASSAR